MRKVKYNTEEERITFIQEAEINNEYLKEDAILIDEKYLIFITLNEFSEMKKQEILKELEQLDLKIPRVVEDIYDALGIGPYITNKEIIERKKQLREELRNLE